MTRRNAKPNPNSARHRLPYDSQQNLKEIWAESRSISPSSPVGRYLISRGCCLPEVPDLAHIRELPPSYRNHFGNLVALVTDVVTAEPVLLHFSEIASEGDRGERQCMAGFLIEDGAVRLTPDEEVSFGLFIAKDIESALSIPTPVWACLNNKSLANFPVVEGIEILTIAANNDAACIHAAKVCAARWCAANREVRIGVAPQETWNDH